MLLVCSTCPKPLRYDLLNVTELGNPAALPLHLTAEIPAEALEAAGSRGNSLGSQFPGRRPPTSSYAGRLGGFTIGAGCRW